MGDSLLAAAFVSYAAPFTTEFRRDLVSEKWLPDLQQRAIPITLGCQPIELLASDTDKVGSLAFDARSSLSQHPATLSLWQRWNVPPSLTTNARGQVVAKEALLGRSEHNSSQRITEWKGGV